MLAPAGWDEIAALWALMRGSVLVLIHKLGAVLFENIVTLAAMLLSWDFLGFDAGILSQPTFWLWIMFGHIQHECGPFDLRRSRVPLGVGWDEIPALWLAMDAMFQSSLASS